MFMYGFVWCDPVDCSRYQYDPRTNRDRAASEKGTIGMRTGNTQHLRFLGFLIVHLTSSACAERRRNCGTPLRTVWSDFKSFLRQYNWRSSAWLLIALILSCFHPTQRWWALIGQIVVVSSAHSSGRPDTGQQAFVSRCNGIVPKYYRCKHNWKRMTTLYSRLVELAFT